MEEFEDEKREALYNKIIGVVCIILVTVVVTAAVTYTYFINQDLANLSKSTVDETTTTDDVSEILGNFREVIEKNFLGEINDEDLLNGAIKGYVEGLNDEYTEYFTKEEWEEFETSTMGNYCGVGIYMTVNDDGNVIVLSTVKGTPAEEANLQENDIIVEVDGENVLGESSTVVSNKIKGEAGTKVKIKFARGSEYFDVELERKNIKLYHVESEMLENNIGYIEISTFDDGCSSEFETELMKLKNENMSSLIIDLRYNTGGIVTEALNIADMFLPKGATELITVDAKGNKEYSYAKKDALVENIEIIILTNEYTASASEILAGCLKDNNLATIVGTTTYGKGVIQSVFSLSDGSKLKMTTQEYYTPNETKIHEQGITPDVEIELTSEDKEDVQLDKAKELLTK